MAFDPNNNIVQLCLKGMAKEEAHQPDQAALIYSQAWEESETDLEKFLAAYYLARVQEKADEKIRWTETALHFASAVNDEGVHGAFPALYATLASSYDKISDRANAQKYAAMSENFRHSISDKGPFYHGTRADLKTGDLLTPGGKSNYQAGLVMNHIYFTALPNGAGLAAALARGEGPERVYVVEPTGEFESDPNVTDKKFPGNPTRSYRTTAPLRIVGEIKDWVRQTPEQISMWRKKLDNNKGEIIN